MEHPVRMAFCPILFAANGGTFDEKGLPIFNQQDKRTWVAGKCSKPHDCGECSLLHEWVNGLMAQGWTVGWECIHCLKETKAEGDKRILPGFYQASRFRGAPENYVEAEPKKAIAGCTRCGWGSSFLQLVLRGGQGDLLSMRAKP